MLIAAATRVAAFCRTHAVWVAVVAAVLTALLGAFTATRLRMDTDAFALIDPALPWRQREIAYGRAFPREVDQLVIVVDGGDPGAVADAADALAAGLRALPALFKTVTRPDGGPFFRRNGLLFLPLDELTALSERIVDAQPLIGSIATDPTLRGLFAALNLTLEGYARGDTALPPLEPAFAAIAAATESVLAGAPRPLAWRSLITGREPQPEELRQFIVVQPVLDFTALAPGAAATAAIRDAARALNLTAEHGVRVRLTGPVALADEEFASVSEGAAAATALSFGLVALLLYLALGSVRIIAANLATLVAGLVATAAFATAAVGSLNLISVAFGVMFVGLAVDFGIQFCVRYREERHRNDDVAAALTKTTAAMAGPLLLAAITTAVGFWSFIPTAYVGVSELGLIAGAGMLIAVALNLTLLPALLTVLRLPGEPASAGYAWAAAIDRTLIHRRRAIRVGALVLAALAAALLPGLRFDADPLNLRSPATESVATLLDLMSDPLAAAQTANVVAPSAREAAALAARLDALPEVTRAISINSFVPEDQVKKLAIIDDLAFLVGPVLTPAQAAAPPDDAGTGAAIAETLTRLRQSGATARSPAAARLAQALDEVLARGSAVLAPLADALLSGFGRAIGSLREALEARRVTLADLPPDIRETWLAADGRARVEVYPRDDLRDPDTLARFVDAVRGVGAAAVGSAISSYEAGQVVVRAFLTATALALVSITVLLALVLRRVRNVLLALAPLVLAGLLTLATCAALDFPINFANIIALPLLLGIGVAFSIYFVMNWRAGVASPLQSPTARAVLFSALTTGAAFGSLALSGHPGTASMGILLAMALAYQLACTLFVLPALLGPVRRA